jgi:hypothetical protein
MTGVGGLILLLLAITSITPAIAALRVEDVLRVQTQLTQASQASRQGGPLKEHNGATFVEGACCSQPDAYY